MVVKFSSQWETHLSLVISHLPVTSTVEWSLVCLLSPAAYRSVAKIPLVVQRDRLLPASDCLLLRFPTLVPNFLLTQGAAF